MLLGLAGTPAARAEGDGVYGRLDSDLRLAASLGVAWQAAQGRLNATGSLRLRYLYAVGLFGGVDASTAALRPFGGVELRPLFPALLLTDAFSGSAWLDLTVQSLGLEAGLAAAPAAPGGLAPFLGLSLESPLRPPSAPGPSVWLRLSARWWRAEEGPPRSGWRLGATLLLDWRLPSHPISGD